MLHTEWVKSPDAGSSFLMIVLHGLGDSMEGYRWLPQHLRIPSLNYLLVNAPDDYHGGFSWYDLPGDPSPGVERSRRALSAVLEQTELAGFPADRTFLFGFSQGCLMTLETGLKHPKQLAGLVGISGYFHKPEELLKKLSPVALAQEILMTHGTRDPLIPCRAVREQAEQFRAAGAKLIWREFNKDHTIAGEEELAVIREFVERRMSPLSNPA